MLFFNVVNQFLHYVIVFCHSSLCYLLSFYNQSLAFALPLSFCPLWLRLGLGLGLIEGWTSDLLSLKLVDLFK